MEKIIHINNTDLFAINRISEYGNSEELNQFVETNFQHSLFSTIFMSGAEYIQLDKSLVNNQFLENPFWKGKFIELLSQDYINVQNKASGMLSHHFTKNVETGFSIYPQDIVLISYFGNLLYSAKTGIPSIVSRFKDDEDLEWVKPALKDEFYKSFLNFQKLIKKENIDTIAPKYSVLKKEVRIFEDTTTTPLFRDYQDLHNELKFSEKISLIAKDIKVLSLKLHYKYLGNFDIKKSAFGYLRDSSSALESKSNPYFKLGNIGVDILEHLFSENKPVNFYAFEEADIYSLISQRLTALAESGNEHFINLIKKITEKGS